MSQTFLLILNVAITIILILVGILYRTMATDLKEAVTSLTNVLDRLARAETKIENILAQVEDVAALQNRLTTLEVEKKEQERRLERHSETMSEMRKQLEAYRLSGRS